MQKSCKVGSFKPEGTPSFEGTPKSLTPNCLEKYIRGGWNYSKMRVYSIQLKPVRGIHPIERRIQNGANRFINQIFKLNGKENDSRRV